MFDFELSMYKRSVQQRYTHEVI